MMKKVKDLLLLSLLVIVSSLFIWLPFILGKNQGMLTVFANYDGPNYLVIAKTWYQKQLIGSSFSLPLPLEYYPSHFPAYPVVIRIFNFFLSGPWSMLVSTLATTVFASGMFYLFLKRFKLSSQPLWLTIIFLFLPARFLVVRSVGSPEPLFIGAILASFYFFKQKRWWLAGIFGALAQITKSPAILLFASYVIILAIEAKKQKKIPWETFPIFLIPLAVLTVFSFYWFKTGDFFAYFHSGDNFHLVFPPFQSFITGRNWIGDFWLEDLVWTYLFGALTVVLLFKQKIYDLAIFSLVFFSATLLIAHRDLSRYSLPLVPFALIAFAPFLEKKEFKIAFLIILLPIYLYAINFISHNVAPVADWTPYL